jgi:hypothetical protein
MDIPKAYYQLEKEIKRQFGINRWKFRTATVLEKRRMADTKTWEKYKAFRKAVGEPIIGP